MRGIQDAIYWRLHSSFLKNERSEARKFLAMLEDEMSRSEVALEKEIGGRHFERFRSIKEKVLSGDFGRIYGPGAGSEDIVAEIPGINPMGSEKEFCRDLMRESHFLMDVIGMDAWSDLVSEVEMPPYGRCDLVAREGRKAAVIEVKIGEAPTSVVSQIDKYRLSMELDMCLGRHDEVGAFVVAASFPEYVASELSRLGVEMIRHGGTPRSLERSAKKEEECHPSATRKNGRSG